MDMGLFEYELTELLKRHGAELTGTLRMTPSRPSVAHVSPFEVEHTQPYRLTVEVDIEVVTTHKKRVDKLRLVE